MSETSTETAEPTTRQMRAWLRANEQEAEAYRPATGPTPEKFDQPLAWSLESPEQSGLPDQSNSGS